VKETAAGLARAAQDAFRETEHGAGRIVLGLLLLFFFSVPFSIFIAQIGCYGALLVWVVTSLRQKKFAPARTGFEALLAMYLLSELISSLWSYNMGQAFLYMQRRMFLITILYVIVSTIRSRAAVRFLLSAFLLSALLVALFSFRDLALNFGAYLSFERRLSAFQMYMTAGGIMMMAALIMIPFAVHPRTPTVVRIGLLLALVPVLINLLFTFTRSSWMGLVAGVIVMGLRRQRKVLLPFLALVAVIVLFSSPQIHDRITSSFDVTHSNNLTRVHMWKTGWKIFLDHPVFGIGDIGTELLWDRYADPGWSPEGHLHNNEIMWLVTLGSVGFLILMSLFVMIWMRLWRIERRLHGDWLYGSLSLGSLGVLTGFHVNGLFEWNFGDAEIMMVLWGITALVLVSERIAPRGDV